MLDFRISLRALFLEAIPCATLITQPVKGTFLIQRAAPWPPCWQGHRRQTGWEVIKVKKRLRVHDIEKRWDGGGGVVATSWWVCSAAKYPSLRASANEIGAVITPAPFNAYDWSWRCLNYVYVPVSASVCSLDDAYFIRLPAAYVVAPPLGFYRCERSALTNLSLFNKCTPWRSLLHQSLLFC